MVGEGHAISRRVLAAVLKEISLIDSHPENNPLPLSDEERAEFKRGSKYFGVYARVAASLGMLNSNMHRVARGKVRSPRVLLAIRAEMARIDAELEAEKGSNA